ncbi:MAG: WG repeat-containing protein [Chitinophagaceae bacterium]|nr:WG repeat-containing protein [Chitinophagaceae bacterium]
MWGVLIQKGREVIACKFGFAGTFGDGSAGVNAE